ncbi:MAG: hypothetical protein A2007_03425 [Verrucomicrobia bacterium GWC2_42_7]|nr:MAG: hypothetical protein A2007_03425 [Verrucomicrobia bacterium GWC2_42_7]
MLDKGEKDDVLAYENKTKWKRPIHHLKSRELVCADFVPAIKQREDAKFWQRVVKRDANVWLCACKR